MKNAFRSVSATAVLLLAFLCAVSCEKTLTVTLDLGYDGVTETVTVKEGEPAVLPVPTREGFRVIGWTHGGRPFDVSTPVTEDLTLEAVWEPTVTVRFHPNGGTAEFTEEVLSLAGYGEYLTFPEISPGPSREGWYFAGWYGGSIPDVDRLVTDQPGLSTVKPSPRNYDDYTALWSEYPFDFSVFLGSYEQDGVLSNGTEPVEWWPLPVRGEDGKILLFSRYALGFARLIEKTEKGTFLCPFADSELRRWLLSFWDTAFTDGERALILPAVQPETGTEDPVFLVSYWKIADTLFWEKRGGLIATPYAISLHPYSDARARIKEKEGRTGAWAIPNENKIPEGETERSLLINNFSKEQPLVMRPDCHGIAPAVWVDESFVEEALRVWLSERSEEAGASETE